MSFRFNPLLSHKLQKKPFVPTDVSDLSDSAGKLFSGLYADLSGKPDLSQLHDQNTDYQILKETLVTTEYFNNLSEPYKGLDNTHFQTISYKSAGNETISYLSFKTENLYSVTNIVIDVFINPTAGQLAGDDIYNARYLSGQAQRKHITLSANSDIKVNFDADINLSQNDIVVFVMYQDENVLNNKTGFDLKKTTTNHVYNLYYVTYSGLEVYFYEETTNIDFYFAVGNETIKTSKAEATAAGIEIPGDLYIHGSIFQSGEAVEVVTEKVYTANDFITMRDGAVSALPAGDISGLEVKLYDGANDLVFGTDQSGFFKVGEPNSLQTLATREDSPLNSGYAYWDATAFMFKTKQPDYNDLANKPFIPSDVSDLTDTSGLFFDGNWNNPINIFTSMGSGYRHYVNDVLKINTYVDSQGDSFIFLRDNIGGSVLTLRSTGISNFDFGIKAGSYQSADGSEGYSGSYENHLGRIITVKNGLITNIA